LLIRREGAGSGLLNWDVNSDCITEHDRRHATVVEYLRAADPLSCRPVATALRYMLESFMRVAYPAVFPPSTMLGRFLETCQQRVGGGNQILNQVDIDEMRAILPYVNRFHHDTNPAYAAEGINDQELTQFCRRVLAFVKRS
jgi:hypothetical protein